MISTAVFTPDSLAPWIDAFPRWAPQVTASAYLIAIFLKFTKSFGLEPSLTCDKINLLAVQITRGCESLAREPIGLRPFAFRSKREEQIVVSQTVVDGLRPYNIGEKIRGLRLRKKMGLVELGRHTGLSAALLSKLERGKLFPTLPTLLRIALVFSVGLEFFFREDKKHAVAVVRKSERQRFPEKPTTNDISYFFESLDFSATERKINSYYADFQPIAADKARVHYHPGIEFLYVINGELALKVGNDEYMLDTGDSIYFDSSVPHSYRKTGKKNCDGIVVTVG
jgi:transcriptional regulator with XRE-family HTH domain